MPIVQQAADRCDYGGLCVRYRRQLIVELPTTTKGLVEGHILKDSDFLGNGILVLKCVLLALRIEDIQKIGHAALRNAPWRDRRRGGSPPTRLPRLSSERDLTGI